MKGLAIPANTVQRYKIFADLYHGSESFFYLSLNFCIASALAASVASMYGCMAL